jgi:hypothetical protein
MINISKYRSLFSRVKEQPATEVFAFFPPLYDPLTRIPDYHAPWIKLAENTLEGRGAWEFVTEKYKRKYAAPCSKLRNYIQYTFARLKDLELAEPGKYFVESADERWVCFNTGLQDHHCADLFSIFERYQERRAPAETTERPDWIYRGTGTAREFAYRNHFGTRVPELAWYSLDSRDFVFNISYTIDVDIYDHMFDRAKERSGFPQDATDESVRNYLRGTIENLLPKIRRNYKTAIPMYYIEERRMQLLLPFASYSGRDTACLLVQRDDTNKCYSIKTVLDMDQAFFAARLITRPDKEWLNP